MPTLGQTYVQQDCLTVSMGALFLKNAADRGVRSDGMLNPIRGSEATQGTDTGETDAMQQLLQSPQVTQAAKLRGGAADYRQAMGFNPGPPGGIYGGQTSGFGLALQGASAYLSPETSAVLGFVPMMLQQFAPGMLKSDFFTPRERYWSGGNPAKVEEFRDAMGTLRNIAAADIDKSVKEHLGGIVQSLPNSAVEWVFDKASQSPAAIQAIQTKALALQNSQNTADKVAGVALAQSVAALQDPNSRAATIKQLSANPAIRQQLVSALPNLGTVVQMFAPSMPPEMKTAMEMIMPKVALDLSPLQDAVMTVTNGRPDATLLKRFADDFNRFYDRATADGGALSRKGVILPKSQALETFAFFKRVMPNGSEDEFANIASGAKELNDQLQLGSIGRAMLVMQQMGVARVAKDPKQLQAFITDVSRKAAAGDIKVDEIMQASEVALKTGRNINEVITGATHAAVLNKALSQVPGSQQVAQRYADAAGKIAGSRTGAIFAAALASGGSLQQMAEQVIQTGDPTLAEKVLRAGRRNMKVMQMAKTMQPEEINNSLRGQSTSAIMVAGALSIAKRMGVSQRDLSLMRDPKFAAELSQNLNGARSRLSAAGQRFYSQTGGAAPIALLAHAVMSKPNRMQEGRDNQQQKATTWQATEAEQKAQQQMAQQRTAPEAAQPAAPAPAEPVGNNAAKTIQEEQAKAPSQTPATTVPAAPPEPKPEQKPAESSTQPIQLPKPVQFDASNKPVSAQTQTPEATELPKQQTVSIPKQPKPWDEQAAEFAQGMPGAIGGLGAAYLGAKRAG